MNDLDSMFKSYIEEEMGAVILETVFGFLFYKIHEKECHIKEIFIHKDYRQSKKCSALIERLTKIALDHGCTHLSANIYLANPNHDHVIKCALALGFSVIAAERGAVVIIKKLEGGI